MLSVEVPNAATSTRPSRITGIAISVSASRIRISPIQPSRSAAAKPQATPTTIATAVAAKRERDRRAAAVEDPRQQVAAELVGAEQVRRSVGGAKRCVEVERRRGVRREERRADGGDDEQQRRRRPRRAPDGRRSRRRTTESVRGRGRLDRDGRDAPCSRDRLRPQARVDEAEEDVDDEARDDERRRPRAGRAPAARRSRAGRPSRRAATRGPGRAKTYSTITAPPTRWATMIPAAVIAGIEAFGSSWRTTTCRRSSPLPLRRPDERRPCRRRASDGRRIRIVAAATPIPSVIAGSSVDLTLCDGIAPGTRRSPASAATRARRRAR